MEQFVNFVRAMVVVFVAGASATAAARTTYDLTPKPTEAQTVHWDNGAAQFDSVKENSKVGVRFIQVDDGKMFFLVSIKNTVSPDKQDSVDVGVDSFTFQNSDGTPVKVFTREELVKSIVFWKNTKKTLAIIGGTAGVLASIAASQQNRNGTATDENGRTYNYSERYTDTGILVAGSAASIAGGVLVLKSANKNADEKIKYLNENYLAKQTLPPGGEVIKVIETEIPKSTKGGGALETHISLLGEEHVFTYEFSKK